jgi:hypothetical protein
MIKALKKLEIRGTFLNIIKDIFGRPITNIMLKVGKPKPFPLTEECPHPPFY